jgi:hypothetical protein
MADRRTKGSPETATRPSGPETATQPGPVPKPPEPPDAGDRE